MTSTLGALEIWVDGRIVADLTMSRRRVPQLRYRRDYVAERGSGALGLSVPLPLATAPFKGDLVDYWIESLLPEGKREPSLSATSMFAAVTASPCWRPSGGTARVPSLSCQRTSHRRKRQGACGR